jgi:hypothetical protein
VPRLPIPQAFRRRALPFCAALALGGLSPRLEASNDDAIAQLNLSRLVLPAYPAALCQTRVAQGNVIVAPGTRRTAAGPAGEFLTLSTTEAQLGDPVSRAILDWRFAGPTLSEKLVIAIGPWTFNFGPAS